MRDWNIYILLISILFTVQTVRSQDFVGYYVSKKVSNGFFITKIAINNDSTFYWNFTGDLIFEERNGKYFIEKTRLIFDLKPDTIRLPIYYKDCELGDIDTTKLPPIEPLIYDNNENVTKRYLVKRNKLIPISKDGKPIYKSKLIRITEEEWKRRRGFGVYKN